VTTPKQGGGSKPGNFFEDTTGGLWMYSGDGQDHHIAEMQPNYGDLAAVIVRDHNEGPGLRAALEKLTAYADAEEYATRVYPSAQQMYHDHDANGQPKSKAEIAAMLTEAVTAARAALAEVQP
jgi:hypothetical protein